MKILWNTLTLVAMVGCTPLPRTEIHVVNGKGDPISGLPLRVGFSKGLIGSSLPHSLDDKFPSGTELLDVRTDENGKAAVEYIFVEKQPSRVRRLFPGAERVPNQWIKITPMHDLPRGSTITVGIPNP